MSEKQTTLPLVSDATLPDATALAVVADELIEPRHGALVDLRQYAMSLPVDRMLAGLSEYKARRHAFRKELLAMLVQGVHYGFPPGTEPKLDDDGNAWVWSGKKQKEVLVKKEQWQHKASFYKAGADFVCDVLGVRDEYKADIEAWQQAGSKQGTFVFACYLMSRSTGELLGEGRGARRVEKDDENKAIKMAKKSAKVDAVLNTYGLADLFTQDMEDGTQPPHDNPTPREDAPQVKPRGERNGVRDTLSVGMLKGLYCDFIGFDRKSADQDAIADAAESWLRFKSEVLGGDVADKSMSPEQVRELHIALEKMETERRNSRT